MLNCHMKWIGNKWIYISENIKKKKRGKNNGARFSNECALIKKTFCCSAVCCYFAFFFFLPFFLTRVIHYLEKLKSSWRYAFKFITIHTTTKFVTSALFVDVGKFYQVFLSTFKSTFNFQVYFRKLYLLRRNTLDTPLYQPPTGLWY